MNLDFSWSEKYYKNIFNFLSDCFKLKNKCREILGKFTNSIEEFIASLKSFKYFLKYLHIHNRENLNYFPYIFTSTQ